MQRIDELRWRSLNESLASINDTAPSFGLVQQSAARRARAASDLEHYRSQGPTGRPDPRHPDIAESFAQGVKELEQRVADADREVRRIEALQASAAERRSVVFRLIEAFRSWAQAQGIKLPGDDSLTMGGFSATVHLSNSPPGSPFGMAPEMPAAPRQGGFTAAAEWPSPRVQPGTSGVVTMLRRTW